jgi:hypothetical protein
MENPLTSRYGSLHLLIIQEIGLEKLEIFRSVL